MPLETESAETAAATVLAARGSMTLGPELIAFAAAARTLLDRGPAAFVLDIGGVNAIDSAGLGEIVNIYSSAARRGIRFAVAGAAPRLREMIAVTHLDEVLQCYSDRQSALAAMSQRA